MKWEAIGAIGEVAGALAVVATLIYLAGQIRSNAKATESQVHASLSAEMERLTTAMAQDDFLSEAMLKAQQHSTLDAKETLRLGWWFAGFMRVCESHFIQTHLKATQLDLETPIASILKGFVGRPFFHAFVRQSIRNGSATKEFLAWLEENVMEKKDT